MHGPSNHQSIAKKVSTSIAITIEIRALNVDDYRNVADVVYRSVDDVLCAFFLQKLVQHWDFLAEFCVQTAQSSFRNTNIAKPYLLNCRMPTT